MVLVVDYGFFCGIFFYFIYPPPILYHSFFPAMGFGLTGLWLNIFCYSPGLSLLYVDFQLVLYMYFCYNYQYFNLSWSVHPCVMDVASRMHDWARI